jgi:phage tail-like protein
MVMSLTTAPPPSPPLPSNGTPPPRRPTEAHAACRFYVEIDHKKEAVFTEVSGLQVEMQVTEYEEGGRNGFIHRLPGRLKVGNIVLKRGLVKANDFFQWCLAAAEQDIIRRHISIVIYDVAGQEVVRWDFQGAYPVKWTGPTFNADQGAVAMETLELAHQGLELSTKGGGGVVQRG